MARLIGGAWVKRFYENYHGLLLLILVSRYLMTAILKYQ